MLEIRGRRVVVRQQLAEVGVLARSGEGREELLQPGVLELRAGRDFDIAAGQLVHNLHAVEDVVAGVRGPLALDGAHAVQELEVAEMRAADDVVLIGRVTFAGFEVPGPLDARGVVEIVVVGVVIKELTGGVVVPNDTTDEVVDLAVGLRVVFELVDGCPTIKTKIRSNERSNGHTFMDWRVHPGDPRTSLDRHVNTDLSI